MKKRFLILGCPRSGTSMLAGMFADIGFYCGENLLRPTISNPRGYYESADINSINNKLILHGIRWRRLDRLRKYFAPTTQKDRRAFAFCGVKSFKSHRRVPEVLSERMRFFAGREAFCYKDPRFSLTLPFWKDFLPDDCRFLVVFRSPEKTIYSYKKNAADAYNPPLALTDLELERAYSRNYQRLLAQRGENWMFIHYDQVLGGSGLKKLESFCGFQFRWRNLDESLRRSTDDRYTLNLEEPKLVYGKLCERAGFPA